MPMTCTICRSPHRDAIEKAIIYRVSYRKIAARYGVGYRSVGRHLACIKRAIRAYKIRKMLVESLIEALNEP